MIRQMHRKVRTGKEAQTSKVNTLSTPLKKQESIEVFEEQGVGLMNGTENRLTSSTEFTKEPDDVECTLTVETGSCERI